MDWIVRHSPARLRRAALAALACMAVFIPAMAHAQVRYTNTTDGTVNETVTPCATPLLRTFTVADIYTVSDVDLGVLMAHTYRGDLFMYLQSPAGTRVQVFTGTGGTANNFNVLMNDAAANPVTGHTANDTANAGTVVPPYQRTFRPANALSAFNGENANGVWTLEICDRFDVDSGTFYQSDLFITATPTTMGVTKSSTIVSDGFNPANPKAIPGATVRYCFTVTNTGAGLAAAIAASDPLPATVTFVPGSIRSGADCATAATVEDDNAAGGDESDPYGASFAGSTVTFTAASLAPGASAALAFDVTIN
jgi:uncharacterized repeat protein (TIGR01451 family)